MQQEKIDISNRIKSFSYALNGIKILVREELNFRIHIIFTVLVSLLGILLKLSQFEWITIIICIVSVLCAEALNTAVELLADAISEAYHPLIKKAKDIGASATLFIAIGAAIVGGMIFIPKLMLLLQ